MAHETQDYTPTPNQRPYEPPQVRDLGSVATITQGPKGGTIDGIFGAPGGFMGS